ncbi:hypothetical protein [Breoghania sp. L-A4]|uniref:hypothetical protein n=1 Tax=Breoghania sp. L-A4 TaxID=2304600 RepID=UPI000E35EA5F|nr:hypothetical protein [Breoghania sp. L-A4]AXS39890.1 hypothetical protein D1F64_07265 [Breoghania sp. L-A4]
MSGISGWFFKSAVVYAIIGMSLGVHMASSHNHDQHVTHAHINLIGWVSFALFGLYYDRFREAAEGWLPRLHFWSAQTGFVMIITGIALIYAGTTEAEPVAAIGSLILLASTVLFAVIVFRTRPAS